MPGDVLRFNLRVDLGIEVSTPIYNLGRFAPTPRYPCKLTHVAASVLTRDTGTAGVSAQKGSHLGALKSKRTEYLGGGDSDLELAVSQQGNEIRKYASCQSRGCNGPLPAGNALTAALLAPELVMGSGHGPHGDNDLNAHSLTALDLKHTLQRLHAFSILDARWSAACRCTRVFIGPSREEQPAVHMRSCLQEAEEESEKKLASPAKV